MKGAPNVCVYVCVSVITTYYLMYFTVQADHRIKMKESENLDKYLDPARELGKRWNMKVTGIPMIIGALGTVPPKKRLDELEIRGYIKTIQTTALQKSACILRRVLETG